MEFFLIDSDIKLTQRPKRIILGEAGEELLAGELVEMDSDGKFYHVPVKGRKKVESRVIE